MSYVPDPPWMSLPHGARAYGTEVVCRAALDTLQATLPAMLAAVNTSYPSDPLVLDPPVAYVIGWEENALNLPPEAFPRVTVVAAPRTVVRPFTDQQLGEIQHLLIVEWLVIGLTPTETAVRSWRYSEAVCAVLSQQNEFDEYVMAGVAFQVDEGVPTPLRITRTADGFSHYVSGGTARIPVLGMVGDGRGRYG
jgi:hypothetical protein